MTPPTAKPHSAPFVLLTIAALAVLAVPACKVGGVGGKTSVVQARAFLDLDGSGHFTPGADEPIVGAMITLDLPSPLEARQAPSALLSDTDPVWEDPQVRREVMTDENGLAEFHELSPSTYVLSIVSGAPEGAVLVSEAVPQVTTPFEGGEVSVEFRYVRQ
jgi:hypothetical protein